MRLTIVLNTNPSEKNKSLAYVDLTFQADIIPGGPCEVTVSGFRVLEKDKSLWVSKPSREYKDAKGDRQFVDLFDCGRSSWSEIQRLVIQAYQDKKKAGGDNATGKS